MAKNEPEDKPLENHIVMPEDILFPQHRRIHLPDSINGIGRSLSISGLTDDEYEAIETALKPLRERRWAEYARH